MAGLFEIYSEAKSIAIAGLYYSLDNFLPFTINKFLQIVPKSEVLNSVYLPRTDRYMEPTYYLIGIAQDSRYCSFGREVKNFDDAESSLTLACLALQLYYNFPYTIGPILGFFSEGAPCAYSLSKPTIIGGQAEVSIDLLTSQAINLGNNSFNVLVGDDEFKKFYKKFIKAFIEVKDKRWNLACIRFISGISQKTAHDAILELAIAIETLLSRGDQIGFSIRLYTALLIGKNLNERKMIQSDIKVFYKLRSQIVHGNFPKFNSEEINIVKKVASYLHRALIVTCGRKIEEDVFQELDYLSLLGTPSFSLEKAKYIITEEEIVEAIQCFESLDVPQKYIAFLKESEFESGENELLFDLIINNETYGSYDAENYLWRILRKKGLNSYSHWLSKDENEKFIYIVETVDDKQVNPF